MAISKEPLTRLQERFLHQPLGQSNPFFRVFPRRLQGPLLHHVLPRFSTGDRLSLSASLAVLVASACTPCSHRSRLPADGAVSLSLKLVRFGLAQSESPRQGPQY